MPTRKRTIRKITKKTVTRTIVRRTIPRAAPRVERVEPVAEWKTYDTKGRVVKVTSMKPNAKKP